MNTGIGLVVSGEKLMFLFIDGTIYSLVKQSAWTSFYAILPKNTVFDHLFYSYAILHIYYILYIVWCEYHGMAHLDTRWYWLARHQN